MTLPPLIPRSVLFGNPDHASPSVSPDARLIGYVAPLDGVLNVWVEPLDRSAPARPVTHDTDRGVRSYAFCHDDRHLLYVQDRDGDESWRLYLLDLETDEATAGDPRRRGAGPDRGPQPVAPGRSSSRSTTATRSCTTFTDSTCAAASSAGPENPGFVDWLVDRDLQVRGGTTMDAEGGLVVQLGRDGSYEPYLEVPPGGCGDDRGLGFTRDGGALLVLSSIGANATRLERHDLATGERAVLASDPAYDVSGLWLDPATLEPQAVEFAKERQEVVLLDASLRPDLDRIHALGEGDVSVNRRERGDRLWVVSLSPSDGPIRFWILDRSTGEARFLFSHRAELDGLPLAPMEPFSFTARDGLTIHGYLTFPPGVERRGLPAVVDVHGGPWARDMWGFDAEAQWLANRGYVCVQVNFRSSTGYGKAFLNAGDKQWGAAMQDDVSDAVEHVVAQGWVDGDRVGIYGGSYGGYAVLAAAAFTPDLYRCGVDIVGPSNLLTLLASVPEYWRPVIAMMYRRVGNPETEPELLRERSPLFSVEKMRIPLLVVQGANDPRVKQAEAEQIVAALREKGLPHEYLLFPDEGHGLAKPQNRETFYAKAETFLAEHLGGRVQESS